MAVPLASSTNVPVAVLGEKYGSGTSVTPRRRYVAEPDILPLRKSGVVYDELVDIGVRSLTSSVILRFGRVVSAPVPVAELLVEPVAVELGTGESVAEALVVGDGLAVVAAAVAVAMGGTLYVAFGPEHAATVAIASAAITRLRCARFIRSSTKEHG